MFLTSMAMVKSRKAFCCSIMFTNVGQGNKHAVGLYLNLVTPNCKSNGVFTRSSKRPANFQQMYSRYT